MIIDYNKDHEAARLYSIVAADTGECLDREGVFFADDEAGYYHRHLGAPNGKYVWDARTKERLTGTFRRIPDEFREVAWERVERPIRLVPKSGRQD